MLRIASILLVLIGASTIAACGDDPVKPGSIDVKWSTGPTSATCGSFQVATVEVRAMKGLEEIASPAPGGKGESTFERLRSKSKLQWG